MAYSTRSPGRRSVSPWSALEADPGCGMAHWARALASLDNPFAWPGSSRRRRSARDRKFSRPRARPASSRSASATTWMRSPFSSASPTSAITAAAPRRSKRRWSSSCSATAGHGGGDALCARPVSELRPGRPEVQQPAQAAAILEPIFKQQPQHPGSRTTSSTATTIRRSRTTGSTRRGEHSRIAPDAAHALHMPSHIFTRVGAWKESIESNRESARRCRSRARRERSPRTARRAARDGLHGLRPSLQLGQDRQAREIIDQMRALEGFSPNIRTGPYALAASTARYAVERNDWKAAAELEVRPPASLTWTRSRISPARSAQRARAGRKQREADIAKLAELRDRLRAAKDAYWAEQVEINGSRQPPGCFTPSAGTTRR